MNLFKSSIQKALENGQGFETWRQGIVPELQRLGWYGRRKVADPEGRWKSKIVDFSKPARLQTIFWHNVRAARAAGQWERIQRTKRGLPYLLYVRTASVEPRPEHLVWAGVILPVDDDFWKTHFPPNGWGCKCAVRQITKFEFQRLDGQDGYTTDRPSMETTTFVNNRTGEVTQVPVGIDPGWQTNPGLARARTLVENFSARLADAGEEAARKSIAEFVASPAPRFLATIPGASFDIPAAVMDGRIVTAPSGALTGKRPRVRAQDLPLVQRVIDEAAKREAGEKPRGFTLRALIARTRWRLSLSRLLQILSFGKDDAKDPA
nr:phage minor head protein [Methylocystis sp. WRRC1]